MLISVLPTKGKILRKYQFPLDNKINSTAVESIYCIQILLQEYNNDYKLQLLQPSQSSQHFHQQNNEP